MHVPLVEKKKPRPAAMSTHHPGPTHQGPISTFAPLYRFNRRAMNNTPELIYIVVYTTCASKRERFGNSKRGSIDQSSTKNCQGTDVAGESTAVQSAELHILLKLSCEKLL